MKRELPKSLIVGISLLIIGVTWWLLARGTRGAEIANVLGLSLAAIGLLFSLAGGTRAVRRPGEITRLWICLNCRVRKNVRLSLDEIGIGPCPKCGVLAQVQLLPDGKIKVTSRPDDKNKSEWVIYGVRTRFFGLMYEITDTKFSDKEKQKELKKIIRLREQRKARWPWN